MFNIKTTHIHHVLTTLETTQHQNESWKGVLKQKFTCVTMNDRSKLGCIINFFVNLRAICMFKHAFSWWSDSFFDKLCFPFTFIQRLKTYCLKKSLFQDGKIGFFTELIHCEST